MPNKLKKILPFESVVFTSPLEDDNEVLVRTGVIPDSLNLLHAFLTAYSKEYVTIKKELRSDYAKNVRDNMTEQVSRETWEQMEEGVLARIPFRNNVQKIIENFYRYIDKENNITPSKSVLRVFKKIVNNNNLLESYRLISELIPLQSGFIKKILLPSCNYTEKVSECSDMIIEEAISYLKNKKEIINLDKTKVKYIINITKNLLNEIVREAKDYSYKKYIDSLENKNDIDNMIDLISGKFNRDIYFIDGNYKLGNTRLPIYVSNSKNFLKNRKKCIIILYLHNTYEVIGKLLPGNIIQRQFSNKDPIVKKIKQYHESTSEQEDDMSSKSSSYSLESESDSD